MSIIGYGDIAGTLPDHPERIYFASGVSNSREMRESEYEREKKLLLLQPHYPEGKHLIYFSSLSVFYSDSRYVQHKREMEKLAQCNFHPCTIIRLGNITWGTNPHTLINFIRDRIRNRQTVEVKDVYRYIIEKDEFLHWISMIPSWSCEMNIPGRKMKVIDIVKEYCYPWGRMENIIRGASNGSSKPNYTEQELQICG